MVENVGVTVEIAAQSLAVKMLFPLPVLLIAILSILVFGQRRPMSVNVWQGPQCQVNVGVVENVGAAFGISSQYPAVQKLFPLPVWWPPF